MKVNTESIYHAVCGGNPIQTAKSKVQSLLQYPTDENVKNILCGHFLYFKQDTNQTLEILKQMTPENAFYILVSKTFESKYKDQLQEEYYYKTKYAK